MDASNRNHRISRIIASLNILRFFCVVLFILATAFTVSAQGKGKVAILPFSINIEGAPETLKTDLQKMFTASFAKKGYEAIAPEAVNALPQAFKTTLNDDETATMGKELGADWVVAGSLSESDNNVMLAMKVRGISNDKRTVPLNAGLGIPFATLKEHVSEISVLTDKVAEEVDAKISSTFFVGNVQVKGNKRIESDALIALVDTKKGSYTNQAALDNDLRTIFKMGYFKDVSIETEDDANGKIVTFNVAELPFITDIKFEGNKEYKEDKLSGEIGIKKFAVLNMSEVKQSVNKLKEYYKKNGYYNISITTRAEERPDNEATLVYVVNEGKKVYITKIQFIGNKDFKSSELEDQMKTNTKGFFYWLTSSGVFERNKLDYDVEMLKGFYRNKGYLDVKIGEPEITYEEKKGLTITIAVTEGLRYKVGNISFSGDVIKPEKELLAKIDLNKQEYFNLDVLYNDEKVLKNIYADEGYANVDVSPRYTENSESTADVHKMDVTFEITKKKKIRVEKINIKGNTRTRDKVIRREMALVEGDYFSGTKIEKSKENLNRLEYVGTPEITQHEGSSDDLVNLDVEVQEKENIGQFQIGAGYSAFDHLFASASVSIQNFLGKGQSLSVEGQVGSRTTQYNFRFVEPWLFDRRISGSFNVYDWETQYTDFTKTSRGGTVGLGFLLGIDDYTTGSVSYSFDKARVSTSYSGYSLVLQDMLGKNIKSSITTGIARDSRDVYFMTSKGSLNSLSLEYAGGVLGGTSGFNKYNAVSAWYIPIWWNNILLVRGSLGLVQQHSGEKLPIYEKFMLGGIDSVRGYDELSISPKDPATGESIGGEKMWLGSVEYRIPIMKKEGVMGLLFFDTGNAFRKNEDWRLRSKRSVGFGMRWRSPMGDLRLEYGIKLDKDPGQDSGGFEFNMGGAF
jgi:outer membrane protein insertion porin family